MTTELCETCSRILPTHGYREQQILGTYDEVLGRARTLEPGRGGCGSCAFFYNVLRSSRDTSHSGVQLTDYINLDYSGSTLHARTADQVDGGFFGHRI